MFYMIELTHQYQIIVRGHWLHAIMSPSMLLHCEFPRTLNYSLIFVVIFIVGE